MNVDKMFTAGNAPFAELALKSYYMKEGERFDKAPEKPYEARAEIGLQLGIPGNLIDTGDVVRDAACKHSFTRKAQEHFQAVLRGEGDMQTAVDGWADTYAKLIMGERERAAGGTARVDSTESLAVRILANVLKSKNEKGELASAKTPIIRIEDPPKTEKGVVNYNAWAKLNKEHPWYAVALKQAEQKKGFE